MDVRSAVQVAKSHIAALYADEDISKIGLEQVEFIESARHWEVTIGFHSPNAPSQRRFADPFGGKQIDVHESYVGNRRYKIVEVKDENGEVGNVRDLFLSSAA